MASEAVMEISDATFDEQVLQSDQPVLVDFWAEWCMPCKMLAPILDELAGQFEGRVRVGKVDVDQNREAATKFGISAIPTLILFKGGEVVQKFVGVTTKDALASELESVAG